MTTLVTVALCYASSTDLAWAECIVTPFFFKDICNGVLVIDVGALLLFSFFCDFFYATVMSVLSLFLYCEAAAMYHYHVCEFNFTVIVTPNIQYVNVKVILNVNSAVTLLTAMIHKFIKKLITILMKVIIVY